MKFSCPECDQAVEACRSLAGFSVRCPSCQHPVAVPHADKPTASSAPRQNETLPPPPATASIAAPFISAKN